MAKQINGASDLYEQMLEMKKTENIKAIPFRKSQAKKANIEWKFVEESAKLLSLEIVKSGNGYLIVKP